MNRLKLPKPFKSQLDGVFSAYFMMHQALSQDDLKGAQDSAKELLASLNNVDMKQIEGPAHMAWMKRDKAMKKSAQEIQDTDSIETARSAFIPLSESLYKVSKQFGTSGTQPVLRFHCSMAAEGKGAHWLQNKTGVENPYYGSAMFTCGEQVETISPGS